jgi:hypothetical protein
VTRTGPPPLWLTALLQRCTPQEQDAISRYRASVSRAFDNLHRRRATTTAVAWYWREALTDLERSASGTPAYDRYVAGQTTRHKQWRAENITGAPR